MGYNAAMRRFGQRIFNGLAVLSLGLCVATVVLWVWEDHDEMLVARQWRQYVARSERGFLTFAVSRAYKTVMDDPPPYAHRWETGFPPKDLIWPGWSKGEGDGRDYNGWWTRKLESRCPPVGFALLHLWPLGADDDAGFRNLFECRAVVVRDWLLASVLALLPAVQIAKVALAHRRARNRPLDHCVRCDYDLTGNISGVCPECGTRIARLNV
jgi:hypothetical protein